MWVLKLLICVTAGFAFAQEGDPLLLTPYIISGNIEEARKLSLVTSLTPNITSYSGFITIEELCDSNLFFWFFPSQNDWLNDPVTLWLQGGPGVSGLKGLLQEHGPYKLTENGNLELRENSINQNSSVIYVDNPIGSGFSYSTYVECYDSDELVISTKLRKGLDQFMTLFPEIADNPFYLGGEGYGGKFAVLTAFDNHISENKTFNLQGLLIESGAVDMPHQFEIFDFLYQVGAADITYYDVAGYFAAEIIRYCDANDYGYASYSYQNTYLDLIGDATGYDDFYSLLYAAGQPLPDVKGFLNSQEVREAIHVGNVTFRDTTDLVAEKLYYTIMRPVRGQIEILLEHYRILFYSGQLSLSFPYSSYRRFIDHINWPGAEEYRNATRQSWYVDDAIAGYVTTAANLYEVLVRNAGHRVLADQTKWGVDLLNKFIFQESF